MSLYKILDLIQTFSYLIKNKVLFITTWEYTEYRIQVYKLNKTLVHKSKEKNHDLFRRN